MAPCRPGFGTNPIHKSHISLQIAGVHPPGVRAEALALVDAGLNDCEISRRLGIPRSTILDWRRPTYRKKTPYAICARCWRVAKPKYFTPEDYAELLGLYLGDGCISWGARTTRLRIALDAQYIRMNNEIRELLARCFPANPIGTQAVHGGSMISSRHIRVICPACFHRMDVDRSTAGQSSSSPGRWR